MSRFVTTDGVMLALEEGALIAGKYTIEKVLGEGGMGVVVAARHIDLDQRVAIKFLLPHALADEAVVTRFAREARAAAKIQSPHVAKVLDVGKLEDGSPYMVMEYLEGEDLEGRIQRERTLPITEAVSIMLQACEAMAEAHAAGIVHRDLKPANLFLARTPGRKSVVKVLDFGISKVTKDGGRAVTQTSTLLGTPYYMSPEQLASSKSIDARSDIWTIGVILYELIGGVVPFIADTMPGVVAQILQNKPTPLRELRPECPEELAAVIGKCMSSNPDMRYGDIAELANALAPFADAASRGTVEAITRTILGASHSPESVKKISSAPTINTNQDLTAQRKQGTLDAASVTSEVKGPTLDLVAEPSEVLPLVDPPAQKKSNLPIVAIALAALLVGGGAAAYFMKSTPTATAGSGPIETMVATPPLPSAPTATTAAVVPSSPPSATASASSIAATTATAPVTTAHGSGTGTAKPSASATTAPTAPVTATATATATVAATVTATATATATATVTSKPSGNPVTNMGIK